MPKATGHFSVTHGTASSESTSNYDSNNDTMPQAMGVEMLVRRVVSKNVKRGTNANVTEMEDKQSPRTSSMTMSTELPNVPEVNPSSIKRVSANQLEFLAQCMERFPALALSRAKGRAALDHSQRKWKQIAAALNKINPTVTKTSRGWLRYWIDLKSKTRRKYTFSRCYYEDHRSVELTAFERRLLRILTDADGNLLCNGAGVDSSFVMKDPVVYNYRMIDDESQPVPEPELVDVSSASSQAPAAVEEDTLHDETITKPVDEDPIGIGKKNIEELQAEVLQFKLRRQKEMHDLEVTQMRERHKLEMEILELKKKRLIQEFDRIKELHVTLGSPRRGGRSIN